MRPLFSLAAASLSLLIFDREVDAAEVVKANNATALNLTGSWFAGVVPVGTDIAVWDATVNTARNTAIGGNLAFEGIKVTGATGLQTIGNTATFALSLGASGIDMSTANTDMTITAVLNFTANQQWTVASGKTLSVSAGNTGSSAISVSGPGNLRLGNVAAFGTGPVTLGADVNIGSTSLTGRILGNAIALNGNISAFNQTIATNGGLTFAAGLAMGAADRTITLLASGATTGSAFVPNLVFTSAVTGPGAMILANGSVATNPVQSVLFSTGTAVNTGLTLGSGVTATFGNANLLTASTKLQLDAGGTVQLASANSTSTWKSISQPQVVGSLNGAGTITSDATGTGQGTFTVDTSVTNVNSTFSGTITNTAPAKVGLAKAGNQTLTLSGTNSYSGTTVVTGGTLQFAKQSALYNNTPANWTAANITVNSGATLALNVGGAGEFTSADIDTIKSIGTATSGFKSGSILGLDTTNATGGSFTYGTVIANTHTAGANAVGVTKAGSGTLVFTAANTYTGSTTVSGGTLEAANATGSATGTGTVTVNATLSGDGAVTTGAGNFIYLNGALQVGATGAVAGSDLSLTTSSGGSTVMGAASIARLDLWSTAGADQTGAQAAADTLRLFGNLDILSGATLKLGNPNSLAFQAGDSFRLFDWTGLGTRTGSWTNIDSSDLALSGLTLDTSNIYTAGTVSIVGVPEPSRCLLMLFAAVGLTLCRRRV